MTDGKRRSANRSVKGDEQSAINGHFAQRGADCFFGQQSMSVGIAVLMPGACEGAANDAGPAIKPASMQIATTKRMKALEVTPDNRTAGSVEQFEADGSMFPFLAVQGRDVTRRQPSKAT